MKYLAEFDNGVKISRNAKTVEGALAWIESYMAEEMPGAKVIGIVPVYESLATRIKRQWKNWEWGKGHISVGRLTIYGHNAMHWALNFWTDRWGYVCFHPAVWMYGRWWPWYLYVSPNATPWAATWGIGPGFRRD